jgi:DNA-binding MarR family transcriptional regulator
MARATKTGDTHAAAELAADLRVTIGKLKRRLREQANVGDLTESQAAVLGRLDREGPATVTTLARAEGMRPQSMGAIVSVLEAAGHIVGSPDPDDGRQTILALTPACRDWIKAHRAAREDWLLRAIGKSLSPDEQSALAKAVGLLRRVVDS